MTRALPPDNGLGEPVRKFEETFSAVELLKQHFKKEVENGLVGFNVYKGEGWNDLTEEERAQALLDFMNAPRTPITASEFDRQTLAPHVSSEEWELMSRHEQYEAMAENTRLRLAGLA